MRRRTLLLIAASLPAACGKDPGSPAPQRLTIACASSLRPAMEEAAGLFEQAHPGIALTFTYGASGTLYAQLLQRAPFDVFLSADTDYPRKLVAAGHAGEDFIYAAGRLALWVPKSLGINPAAEGLACLRHERVKRVAIANPQLAPYGRAALEALEHSGLRAALEEKLVTAENVSQAAQYVQSGAAQAGLIAQSLTLAAPMQAEGTAWTVPQEFHAPMEQSGVILPWTRHRAAAEKFRAWLLSAEGAALLSRHGFSAAPHSAPHGTGRQGN